MRLTDLPPELLHQILEYLIPEFPEVGDTRPVSYDKLAPEEPWYDITRNRRALRSLCLTSRQLFAVARPLLYRVISILDEEGMLLLFRTLTERPAIGECTRYLSCHLTLTRLNVVREMKRAMMRLVNTFRPDQPMLKEEYPAVHSALTVLLAALPFLSASGGDFDDVPQILLFYIASFMKKLETFMLQVPIFDDHPEYAALFEKFAPSSLLPAVRVGPAGEAAPVPFISVDNFCATGERPLQYVKTLLLQGDPELLMHFEGDSCDCEMPELWGVQVHHYYPLFTALPSLTTLEVSSDDGVWNQIRHRRPDGSPPPYLERIKHLYLHNSIAFPRDLHHILANAPDLVTLYMTPRRDPEPFFEDGLEGMDEHPESLDAALTQQRPRQLLRHLDIAWYDCGGIEALIGPEGRLASLPRLARLEKLCVQLCVLYGDDPATLLTPMADLLPPNLVELTLEEWWWENVDTFDEMFGWTPQQRAAHYQSKGEYRAQAMAILARFATDCGADGGRKMPRLRKVTFQTKFLWTWRLDGYVAAESHFEGVRRLFAGCGIEFRVEEDQSECIAESVAS